MMSEDHTTLDCSDAQPAEDATSFGYTCGSGTVLTKARYSDKTCTTFEYSDTFALGACKTDKGGALATRAEKYTCGSTEVTHESWCMQEGTHGCKDDDGAAATAQIAIVAVVAPVVAAVLSTLSLHN